MVYLFMKRNCAYTDKESFCSDRILPKELAEDEVHNWAISMPASVDYKESKGGELPSDLEVEIHETFYLIELTKIRLKFLEKKLEKLQQINPSRGPAPKSGAAQKNKEKIKKKQIEAAIVEKEIVEDNSSKIDEFLEKKKKSLF